jgi:hypothetical protein
MDGKTGLLVVGLVLVYMLYRAQQKVSSTISNVDRAARSVANAGNSFTGQIAAGAVGGILNGIGSLFHSSSHTGGSNSFGSDDLMPPDFDDGAVSIGSSFSGGDISYDSDF